MPFLHFVFQKLRLLFFCIPCQELARSARFYIEAEAKQINLASPSRKDLLGLCENITLEASVPHAIVGSRLVDITERLLFFPIAGFVSPKDSSKTALDFVNKAFPGLVMVPHRLLIPLVLVSTAGATTNCPEAESLIFEKLMLHIGSDDKSMIPEGQRVANLLRGHIGGHRDLLVVRRRLETRPELLDAFNRALDKACRDLHSSEALVFSFHSAFLWDIVNDNSVVSSRGKAILRKVIARKDSL